MLNCSGDQAENYAWTIDLVIDTVKVILVFVFKTVQDSLDSILFYSPSSSGKTKILRSVFAEQHFNITGGDF